MNTFDLFSRGRSMILEEFVVIDSDPDRLFWLTQDYSRRLDWDPFLQVARLVGDAREPGVGVRAFCVSRNGWAMETEYVSFNPPDATAIKMTQGPWFLESFAGTWRFESVAPERTRVVFLYSLLRPTQVAGVAVRPSDLACVCRRHEGSADGVESRSRASRFLCSGIVSEAKRSISTFNPAIRSMA